MKFAQSIIILLLAICTHATFCQDDEFIMISDSEIVEIRTSYSGLGFPIIISKLPDEIIGQVLAISNLKGTCSGAAKIVGAQFFLETSGKCSSADTFVAIIYSSSNELIYPAEAFTSRSLENSLKLGANCYRLNCVPDHDPWMPTAYDPFFFRKNGYYINPKNGRIKKGSWLINSGNYSICDLKNWNHISPYGIYFDRNRNKFTGSELIANRKIELADWNLEVFDMYWFR